MTTGITFPTWEQISADGVSIGEVVGWHHQLLQELSYHLADLGLPAEKTREDLKGGLWFLRFRCRLISDYGVRESAGERERNVARMLECYPALLPYHTAAARPVSPFDIERLLVDARASVVAALRQVTVTTEAGGEQVAKFTAFVSWCQGIQEKVGQNWFVRR